MYFWPQEFNADMGIARQMKAQRVRTEGVTTYMSERNAPQVQLTPAPHLVNDGKSNMMAEEPGQINQRRQAMLAYLKPAWR